MAGTNGTPNRVVLYGVVSPRYHRPNLAVHDLVSWHHESTKIKGRRSGYRPKHGEDGIPLDVSDGGVVLKDQTHGLGDVERRERKPSGVVVGV